MKDKLLKFFFWYFGKERCPIGSYFVLTPLLLFFQVCLPKYSIRVFIIPLHISLA